MSEIDEGPAQRIIAQKPETQIKPKKKKKKKNTAAQIQINKWPTGKTKTYSSPTPLAKTPCTIFSRHTDSRLWLSLYSTGQKSSTLTHRRDK